MIVVFRVVIILMLISFNSFVSTSAFADLEAQADNKQEILKNKSELELISDLQYLLSPEETIDYDDPKLNKILNKYNYSIFKLYKAFIEFDKSNKAEVDIIKAKSFLAELDSLCIPIQSIKHVIKEDDIIDAFLDRMVNDNNFRYMLQEIFIEDKNIKKYSIPLWLVRKYPESLNHHYGRWAFEVNATSSAKDIDTFNRINLFVQDMRAQDINLCAGTFYRDIYASWRNHLIHLSYAPKLILENENLEKASQYDYISKYFDNFEQWSYEGIWNMLKYKKFLSLFESGAEGLADYYRNNYGLKEYAPYAKLILAKRISLVFGNNDSRVDYTIINLVRLYKNNIEKLKELSINLDSNKKGAMLFHAVVSNLDIEFIKWLINNGANIDAKPLDETALMASVRNPQIMQLLIDYGANPHLVTYYGKNALFYAVQFGSLESVSILIKAGADVNSKIHSEVAIRAMDSEIFFYYTPHPQYISEFTPLIYAKRYASQEVINLLIKHGAKDGPADPKTIKAWISEGAMDI